MRKTILAAGLAAALLVQGCASAQVESRDTLLRQIRANLVEKIGPRYRASVEADESLIPEQKEQDVGLVDDTIASIDRALQGDGPEAPAGGAP